jgi:hypothetical protein
MSRPRKLTDEQLEAARASQGRRRALMAELRALPTLRQYAREWRCTERLLWSLLQSS